MPDAAKFPWPIRVLHLFNPWIVRLLRSPLHGLMSKELLVLEYRGRKTGKTYATPLAYVRHGRGSPVLRHAPPYELVEERDPYGTRDGMATRRALGRSF